VNRINSVDTIRFLAITSVIAIHTSPFSPSSESGEIYYYLNIIINQMARFAVPFFFVISGYFWGVKIRSGADITSTTKNMVNRIGVIFLAWSLIYIIPFNLIGSLENGALGPFKAVYWNLIRLFKYPINTLFQGSAVHLWFLISLIFSVLICGFFIKRKAFKLLAFLSIALYILGVFSKSYVETPVGMDIGFNTRNGPFFGLILFYLGFYFSSCTPNVKWLYYGFLIFIVGSAIHFAEVYTLMKLFGTSVMQDYVFGTLLMGIGMSMLALSNHSILQSKYLSKMSTMTLGVYASHYIFVDLFRPLDNLYNSAIWEIGYVFIVLIFSIFTTHLLSKTKITRPLVL